ncbi:MAG TPA: response regulator [Deltaproteobacteria bacterium]|nr:response regulator [Deltaproteobacteria bacterium]
MSESESESNPAIVVVDADPTSRNAAEDLEDELDRPIIAIDSMEFDVEASEEILGAGVFVICWDLEIRSGADLVEEIRRHEDLAERTILVAFEEPTPERVRAAMWLGADGVCMKPYDAAEIQARLERLDATREAQAA